jgi:hypothetical protein
MNKKVIIHGVLLGGLLIYTWVVWSRFEASQEKREDRADGDIWAVVEDRGGRSDTAMGMIQVAVPLLASTIYGAALAIIYGLPALVGRVTEEMIGSTAEVDPDPLDAARDAVVDGEYSDAIAIYHKHLLENPGDRSALLEIVKLQRKHLESPALAVNTLAEGLQDYDWEPDDRAFIMFRMAEIYEEDLEDRDKVIEVMKKVAETLPETRHAGNANHRLQELDRG